MRSLQVSLLMTVKPLILHSSVELVSYQSRRNTLYSSPVPGLRYKDLKKGEFNFSFGLTPFLLVTLRGGTSEKWYFRMVRKMIVNKKRNKHTNN